MANENIIRSNQVRIIIFFLGSDLELIFSNIVYTLECDFNDIFLCQLQMTSIYTMITSNI